MQCACAVLLCVACPALQCFFTLSHKRRDFRNLNEYKICVLSGDIPVVCVTERYSVRKSKHNNSRSYGPHSFFSLYIAVQIDDEISTSNSLNPWDILSPTDCWTWWWPTSRPKHVVQLTTLLQKNLLCFDFLTLYLYQICILRFSTNLSDIFLTLRRVEQDMIIKVYRSSYNIPIILIMFWLSFEFSRQIFEKSSNSNFMKFLSLGADLFNADLKTYGRTDTQRVYRGTAHMTRPIVIYRNYAKST